MDGLRPSGRVIVPRALRHAASRRLHPRIGIAYDVGYPNNPKWAVEIALSQACAKTCSSSVFYSINLVMGHQKQSMSMLFKQYKREEKNATRPGQLERSGSD